MVTYSGKPTVLVGASLEPDSSIRFWEVRWIGEQP
uniref:Uncharacterized protein n=1 Tax=Arundo donax TaxID=35708 RepID=A0A0A9BXC2_ARUDO